MENENNSQNGFTETEQRWIVKVAIKYTPEALQKEKIVLNDNLNRGIFTGQRKKMKSPD